MKSLIDNAFRKQLKRLSKKCECEPRVTILFSYTDEDFKYLVTIGTIHDYAEQLMDTITEENIKRMVDGLIHRSEERTVNEIRMSDFGQRVYNIHNIECTPYPREWDEVQSVEVCNG